MFRNYLKITTRSLFRNKGYSFINIFGLAIGMAGSLLVSMYVANEMSYENFHQNRARIYRVALSFGSQGTKMNLAGVMPALGPAMIEEIPEVDNAVRFRADRNASFEYSDIISNRNTCFFADPSIFGIFTFNLIEGNKNSILEEPHTLIITEKMAQKYFGDNNPVGKVITYSDEYLVQIVGVMKDAPANTHLKFDCLMSFSSLEPMGLSTDTPWNQFGDCFTYLLLNENAAIDGLETKIKELLSVNTNEHFADMFDFHVHPLRDIHMISGFMGELESPGNRSYVILFSIVSVLVLVIACFNFMNLSTARSMKRMKEIGVRKVLGAKRLQLVKQFLTESLLIALVAIALGLVLFELFYPMMNSFLGNTLEVKQQNFRYLFFFTPLILIIVGLFAGSYPALYFSRNTSIECLKSDSVIHSSRSWSRRILIVAQFAIAIILIIGTITVFNQLHYMINTDLGFDKENVVLVHFSGDSELIIQKYPVLKEELSLHPNILSISGAYTVPGINSSEKKGVQLEDAEGDNTTMLQTVAVDYDFVDVMGLNIISGRNFSKEFQSDETSSVLLNQMAISQLNLQDPIGKKINMSMPGGMIETTIIGVINDFHLYSKQQQIEPMLLYMYPERYLLMAIRVRPEDISLTLASIEDTWNRVIPDAPCQYSFLDETYGGLYDSEEKIGYLFTIFSLLAILIASLGLFGLASFSTEQKTKEIGIRKVLGASVSGVVFMLSKEFTKWVLLANIIAWPIAYFAMKKWLNNFAYKVEIGIEIFIISAVAALVIAMLTVSYQAIKAAIANPIKALRYE